MNENLFGSVEPAFSPTYVAHCDGGSRGNPGPAGYGAIIEDPDGRTVARLSEFLGIQTNNFAEYSGLLAVLRWAREHGVERLKVVSDSELMVNQMKGRYKVASPILRPLWEEARRESRALTGFQIAHTLRGGNKEADRLANEAMDRGMGRKPQGSGGKDQGAETGTQKPAGSTRPQESSSLPDHPRRQVLNGFVKNGVVHLLEGELPDGIYVKVVRE